MKMEKSPFKRSEKPHYKIDEQILTSAVAEILNSEAFVLICVSKSDNKLPNVSFSHFVVPHNKAMYDEAIKLLHTKDLFKQLIINNGK